MPDKEELLAQVQELSKNKKWQEADELLTWELLEKYQSAELYGEKAEATWRLKHYDDCQKAVDLALILNDPCAKVFCYQGNLFSNSNNYSGAEESYRKALEIDPSCAPAYNGLGILYYDKKDYAKAEEYYRKVLEVDPDYAFAYNGLGILYYLKKDYAKAEEYYRKALELDPDYAYYAYFNLGFLYQDKKEYSKAEVSYLKVLELDPKHASAYHYLGFLYYNKKDYAKAEEYYRKALELDPGFAHPYNGLGNLYQDKKDYAKAEEYYRKALELDPDFAYPYHGLGVLYYDKKDYAKAEEYYRKALELDPKRASAYYNLGLVYKELAKNNQAKNSFESYLTLEDDAYWINKAEEHLEEITKRLKSDLYDALSEDVRDIKRLLEFEGECITHYTSLSASKELLLKEGRFRLSEGSYLNDTSEGRELFRDIPRLAYIKESDDTIAKRFLPKFFIGSFVADLKYDDLALWRMYGKEKDQEACGIAITFFGNNFMKSSIERITGEPNTLNTPDEDFNLYRIAYASRTKSVDGKEEVNYLIPGLEHEKQSKFNELMSELVNKVNGYLKDLKDENTEERQNITERISEIAYLFKSVEYQYEQEIRLIVKGVNPVFKKVMNLEHYHPPRVYIELDSLPKHISKITLGPKVDRAEEWAAAFHYHLEKSGDVPEILISRLPFK